MIISLCLPCKNRTPDLRVALPAMIRAANASPPVEICVLNYNSDDDLDEYIATVNGLKEPNRLIYAKCTGRQYFHQAHSRNLAYRMGTGEYTVTMGADILLAEDFIVYVRERIAEGAVWMATRKAFGGVVVVQAREFAEAGGYDERFEFYGSQGTDLVARLQRRGGKFARLPDRLLAEVYTSNRIKLRDYDPQAFEDRTIWLKRAMGRAMRAIYEENVANHVLVANAGKEWGQWI